MNGTNTLASVVVIAAGLSFFGCAQPRGQDNGCTQNIDCDDGNPCTDDLCLPSGVCEQTANVAPCDDGNSCTSGDTCASAICVGGSNACPCDNNADCQPFEDGDSCNGSLVCGDGDVCNVDPTSVVTCATDQDTDCTKNTCAPANGTCALTPVMTGTECSDGDPCTSADTCQAGICRGGVEACCEDQVNNDGDGLTDCDDPDCSSLPVCEGACAALEPVEDAPLSVEAATNAFESTTVDGFSDDYVYNAAGTAKIGTRQEWGGTIIFFGTGNGSPGINTGNVIDSQDTGREVQVAFYDPDRHWQDCAWNASCATAATTCPQEIVYLGWNPVQGGNRCNNGSGYDDLSMVDGAIEVTATPLFWNPHWDRSDCNSSACGNPAVNTRSSDVEVVQKVRFVRPNIVELSYLITNLQPLDHRAFPQEFPTVYTANGRNGTHDLRRLYNSNSQEVGIDTAGPEGLRFQNFQSPGGWVAMQNPALDYGVALYHENGLADYQAWQANDPKFNNFRGLFAFAIPGLAQIRARSYLILGSLATVAGEAQWLDNNLAPFGSLDGPVAGDMISGNVAVHGWAMDNKGVSAVQLIIDGGPPITLNYGNHRPDVCQVWPGYGACAASNVGYTGSFDAGALTPAECGHVLEIKVIDTDGNSRVIARRRVYLTP